MNSQTLFLLIINISNFQARPTFFKNWANTKKYHGLHNDIVFWVQFCVTESFSRLGMSFLLTLLQITTIKQDLEVVNNLISIRNPYFKVSIMKIRSPKSQIPNTHTIKFISTCHSDLPKKNHMKFSTANRTQAPSHCFKIFHWDPW